MSEKNYGVCGEFGWVGFLVVCFLYKINPNPPKMICCGEKSGPNATFFNLIFLGLGWPWVGECRRFHNTNFMFSDPTEFGESQAPYQWLMLTNKRALYSRLERQRVSGLDG